MDLNDVTKQLTRAQFVRGNFSAAGNPTRPPWSLLEMDFVEACSRCGDCLSVCPEKILRKGRGGFPEVDFSLGECTFCGDCTKVCKTGALDTGREPWLLKAQIASSCLALKQVACRNCGEACPTGAIHFRLAAGMVARPEITTTACTGCGACVSPCPVAAVTIAEMDTQIAA